MSPASPRTQGKRPGDLTGVRNQQLTAQAKREKVTSAAAIADELEAERIAKAAEEVDYTSEGRAKAREAAQAGVVEEADVEVRPKTKRIRVNWPVEQMTFGKEIITPAEYDENGVMTTAPVLGSLRTFDFEEGRWYTVDYDVYQHLAFLGYVYE